MPPAPLHTSGTPVNSATPAARVWRCPACRFSTFTTFEVSGSFLRATCAKGHRTLSHLAYLHEQAAKAREAAQRQADLFRELDRVNREALTRVQALTSPYELVRELTTWNRESRMRLYGKFIALVSTWPPSDQDALLRSAKPIFHVNIRTMRADLKRAA